MDYSKLGLFSLIQQKMAYIGERQAVIAQNIANADTPHYKAKDLKPIDFGQLVAGSALGGGAFQMVTTNPMHINPQIDNIFATEVQKSWDGTPDGNGVVVEDEAQKMNMNSLDYQSVTSVYAKFADLIRTVVTDK